MVLDDVRIPRKGIYGRKDDVKKDGEVVPLAQDWAEEGIEEGGERYREQQVTMFREEGLRKT